ncbi:hypothetical protein Tco_0528348 [Tanacetum coccineum]
MFIPNNSTVPKLQTAEDLQGDALLHYDAEMELMNLILLSIPNDIYNYVDACTSAKDMWKRVERLMRGTIQNKVDRETRFTNEFDQFVAEPGEALVSVYNRFAQLMNDLKRNDMLFSQLFQLTQTIREMVKSHSKEVRKSHDPFGSRRLTRQDDVHTNFEDPLTSAMLLLARAITQKFSTPTNNHLDFINTEPSNHSSGKGHFARNYPKPRVRDSKYFMEQMLLAKQDEAKVILTDEQNNFIFADASRMEEIEELSANICLMARIYQLIHSMLGKY